MDTLQRIVDFYEKLSLKSLRNAYDITSCF